jgi:hypothetical protein
MPKSSAIRPLLPLATAALACCAAALRSSAEEPAPPVRESAPEIFYVPDDAGRLVPVPGFRYRDFVELLRLKEGLPGLPEAPPAVLEQVAVRLDMRSPPAKAAAGAGDASSAPPAAAPESPPPADSGAAGAATCPVEVELTIRQSRPGWVSLPVELAGLMLSAPPRYQGAGRMLLDVDDVSPAGGDASRGYRVWLSGSAGGDAADLLHRVSLAGAVPLEADLFQESVAIELPRATASRIELSSRHADPQVTVQPRSLPPRVEAADGGSRIALVGLAGPVKISVGDKAAAARAGVVETASSAALPSAFLEGVVRVDGRTAVTQATIRLERLAADATTLRVRLPARTDLRGVREPAQLVAVEHAAGHSVAVIQVVRDAEGRAVVACECERQIDPAGKEPFDPLGFAVEGIPDWRQSGRASIAVEGDWQVTWDPGEGTRRVDAAPGPPPAGFVAAFAYAAQPGRLSLRVRPRASRVVIEPEYRCSVEATRVRLEASLRISVRGAPVEGIDVAIEGWKVEDEQIGPQSVVDTAAAAQERGWLRIPFVQPLSGDTVVEIRGSQPLERDATRVGWRLPEPRADLLVPATVVIVPQSDIELVPDAEAIQGLVRQVTPAGLRPDAERFALVYRLEGPRGEFAAARRFLPRRIDAAIVAQADVDVGDTIVRETIRYDVAHVPMEFVTLLVPGEVARAGSLEVRQNGQLLHPDAGSVATERDAAGTAPSEAEPRPASDAVRMTAMLERPLLGQGEVSVQFTLPTPPLRMETTLQYELPLVLPAEGRIGRQSVGLTPSDAVTVEPRGDEWKRDITGQGAVGGRSWTAVRPQDRLPLALSARRPSPLGQTVVDAAWLQTRLLGERREDAFTYVITTSAGTLALALPRGLVADDGADGAATRGGVDVRLDGEPLPAAIRPDGRIVIDLPERGVAATRLVEIVVERQRSGLAEMVGTAARLPKPVTLEAPRFPEGTLERRFYWELIVDPDEHALGHPGQWTSQQRWEWSGVGMRRTPVVSRERLRSWIAATGSLSAGAGGRAVPLPPDMPTPGTRAVYSGVGAPGVGRVWLVPTWLLVLAASAPVLGLGLLLVHRPRLRSPALVLGVAAAAGLVGAVFPEAAPLFAQAALPGAALAVVAAALRWFVNRSGFAPRGAAVPPVSASSITQPAPSLIVAESSGGGGDGSAPTAPTAPRRTP